MDDDQRLVAVQAATTYDELRQAMDGYYARAVELSAELRFCEPLRRCLEAGVYLHAITDLDDRERAVGAAFPAVRRILQSAADKHRELGGQVPLDLPHRS